jgi:gamma-glutamylcyclotransferase (GGCT)/AIG2-like uncharacterized protein YtfP
VKRLGARNRLAVYGSLAPGQANHHVLAGLRGEWRDGTVRGDLHPVGWGMTFGFPALAWRADGPVVPVKLFESFDLPAHWRRLDAFEGNAYRRVVVPVKIGDSDLPANIYVVAR